MKQQFVKTENNRRFLAGVTMVENRGSSERCVLGVKGLPGVGKTRITDNWGSSADAVVIEGVPGMTLRYVRDALKAETGVTERGNFAEFAALVEFFHNRGKPRPIIFDECQHGFRDRADCVDWLRRLAEKAGTILVLVCHSSEARLLDKHDHIKSRIGSMVELLPPGLPDTALFATELCEVSLDEALIKEVHAQGRQRYRLIADALASLERIAAKLGKTSLSAADVAGIPLCTDWELSLKAPAKSRDAKGGR